MSKQHCADIRWGRHGRTDRGRDWQTGRKWRHRRLMCSSQNARTESTKRWRDAAHQSNVINCDFNIISINATYAARRRASICYSINHTRSTPPLDSEDHSRANISTNCDWHTVLHTTVGRWLIMHSSQFETALHIAVDRLSVCLSVCLCSPGSHSRKLKSAHSSTLS